MNMKKIILGLSLLASMTVNAINFSFEKDYNLLYPVNSERIGAIVELKDYLELNPQVANAAIEINNLSFIYKGINKSKIKGKICFQVGKLDFFNDRIQVAKERILSDVTPRLLNKDQSKMEGELLELSNGLSSSLYLLKGFCEGEKNLNNDEIKKSVRGLSSLISDTAYNLSYTLKQDSLLVPQDSELYVDYFGAKHEYENPVDAEDKKCSIKDLF